MGYARNFASSIAFAICLGACGGSGGGGIASTPTPTSTPSPTPTPIPAAIIGAPAIASIPNAGLLPAATTGGPTLDSHATTTFPLLQTAVSISPAGVIADGATISGGSTLSLASTRDKLTFNLGNAGLGISNAVLMPEGAAGFSAQVGAKQVIAQLGTRNPSELDWTSFGFWDVVNANGSRTTAAFVTGFATPVASLPTNGTASYAGNVDGEVILPQAGRENGVNYLAVRGIASIQADFGTGSVTGTLSEMGSVDFDGNVTPWNSVSLVASLAAGQNLFTGTTSVTSAPGTLGSLTGSATGTVAGMFFGPAVEQLGAVWTLSDGVGAAFGTIQPTSPGPWDY